MLLFSFLVPSVAAENRAIVVSPTRSKRSSHSDSQSVSDRQCVHAVNETKYAITKCACTALLFSSCVCGPKVVLKNYTA